MTTTLSLATENFGDAQTAWDTWTLHFNIALTKVIICCTIFTDGTTVWQTHSHVWKPDKKLASKYLCIQEELQRRLWRGLLSDCFFLQDEDRCFMAGTITLFTFSTTTSLSEIYTQQSENIGSRGRRLYTSLFFLISSRRFSYASLS